MPSRSRARYRRRRVVALAFPPVVAAVVAWLLLDTGHRRPRRSSAPAIASTTATARALRPSTRAGARPLPLGGIPVGRWTTFGTAPTSRGEVSAARLGDAVYVVGGFDAAGHTSATVQRLNLRTRRWSPVASMPQALNHMSATAYRGSLYVVGGYASSGDSSTGATRGFWRYSPRDDRWSAMPPAPVPRAAAGAAVLGHRLYVVGGRNDTTPALSSLAIFDFATSRWSLGPPLSHPREHLAAVAAGGAVWALGGRDQGVNFTYVERYRPGAAAWESQAPMPVPRSGFQTVAARHSLVAVGGEDGAAMVPEVERLDLRSGRWAPLAPLPAPRHGLGVVADGPLVFTIDGGTAPGLTTSRVMEQLRAP